MSSETLVRLGFIGAGGICRNQHLPRLGEIEGIELVAVSNRSRESSEAVAGAFGFSRVEADWRAVAEAPDIDAVFIGTWPYTHAEMSVAALEAGKHTFCQARMAADLAGAERMVAAAETHPGLVNMICPPPHRMPWEPWILKTLNEGRIGKLLEVRVEAASGANLARDRVSWREDVAMSGIQILAMGIWAETLNAWVGPYASLAAQAAIPIPEKRNESGQTVRIEIPQIVSVAGRLQSGAFVSEHHTGLAHHERTNAVTFWGSEGTLRVDLMHQVSLGAPGGALEPVEVPEHEQRPWRVERDFIEAVHLARDGAPPEQRPVSCDFREGLAYMKKMDAVHRSAASGEVVELGA